ncbi:AB hydrolase-1 domain-containing protein [Pycnococcus provasolii]
MKAARGSTLIGPSSGDFGSSKPDELSAAASFAAKAAFATNEFNAAAAMANACFALVVLGASSLFCTHVARVPIASRRTLRIVDDYSAWLATTQHLPKLYLHAEPGFFAPINDAHSSTWPNVTRHCVKGLHFCQEDDADTIGQHIARFVDDVHKSGGVPRSKL